KNQRFARGHDADPNDKRRRHRKCSSSQALSGPTKWEAAAKLAAGPVGSTWKLTQRTMRAKSVYEFAHATSDSPPFSMLSARCPPWRQAEIRISAAHLCGQSKIGNRKSKMKQRRG